MSKTEAEALLFLWEERFLKSSTWTIRVGTMRNEYDTFTLVELLKVKMWNYGR